MIRSFIRNRTVALAGLLAAGIAPACTAPLQPPELGGLYGDAARYPDIRRNPVVVIPGILGSKLSAPNRSELVWGAFTPEAADPSTPDGARLIALPMRRDAALADLSDEVRTAGVLDRVKLSLLGLRLEVRAYANILATLGVGGYRDELLGAAGAIDYGGKHYTCFQFAYDWRRDNFESARRLREFLEVRRDYVRDQMKQRFGVDRPEVRFDLVCHSMGGLVARCFLMYGGADIPDDGPLPPPTWAGAEFVENVILVGTPNAGSAESLIEMVDGAKFGPGLPTYSPAVLGTMPSVYQLLPRSRHRPLVDSDDAAREVKDRRDPGDLLDAATWERYGWGLADPRQAEGLAALLPDVSDAAARREIALEHLRKCLRRARRFAAALDQPATPPPHVRLALFAGDSVATPRTVAVNRQTGRIKLAAHGAGDGTVLRTSALLDEREGRGEFTPGLASPIPWQQVMFLFTDHIGLTRDPVFTDNVLFTLLERPRAIGR